MVLKLFKYLENIWNLIFIISIFQIFKGFIEEHKFNNQSQFWIDFKECLIFKFELGVLVATNYL